MRVCLPALFASSVLGFSFSDCTDASECSDSVGPDLVGGEIVGVKRFGTVNEVTGYALGFVACNFGTEPIHWNGSTASHPVVAQNLYRLKSGRFEQIGMSWCKHVSAAGPGGYCCTCVDPQDIYLLGVGCSDAYGASLNGNQAGSGTAGGLGPRSDVNPFTGELTFPYASQGQAGDAIYKRLQVKNSDLDPDNNPEALYFAESHFVSADDAAVGNHYNNVSVRQVIVGDLVNGGWELTEINDTAESVPAIQAWQQADPEVSITNIDIPGDGRLILASRCTENGNGTWHYEYALYNLNSDRAARMFSIPLPPGIQPTNIGFHDVAYHSGEPYSSDAWESTIDNGFLRWKTATYDDDPNANALRWGTLYNFRFNINAPPSTVTAKVYLFKPGSPDQIPIEICGPSQDAIENGCEQASNITLGSTGFTNINATESGPSMPCAASVNHVLWFKYLSTFTGTLRISTCNAADFDTALAVYSGCSCASFIPLGCNHNSSQCGNGSLVEVEVQAGDCCLIQLASTGAAGSGTLTLSCADSNNAVRADAILTGDDVSGQFGRAAAAINNLDGNAIGGIVVGAWRNDLTGTDAGAAKVFNASSLDQVIEFHGSSGDSLGQSVASSDFNGDGIGDWVIGAPLNDENGASAGKVIVVSGANQSVLWEMTGQSAGDRFGWAVASAGDVNDDGADDVLVGAPWNDAQESNAGRVYVLNGESGAVIYKLNGRSSGDHFGCAVSGLGDLNDDGMSDFAIGAPLHDAGDTNSGRVYVYSGIDKKVIQKIDGSDGGDQFGSSLAGLTYGSGASVRTLLLIGAPLNNANGSNSGQAEAFVRKHTNPACGDSLCPLFTFKGKSAGDRFGTAVAIGKVVGNSKPDFAIGAPYADLNGASSGTFSIFDGSTGDLERRVYGEAPGDRLGYAVSAADINGDAKDDLVVGAPTNDAGGNAAGRVYLFLSTTTELAFLVADPDVSNDLLAPKSSKGDATHDGIVDATDLITVLDAWGLCPTQSSTSCHGDIAGISGDGRVDIEDLMTVVAAWSDLLANSK
jgi:hypothetical protein